MPTAATTPHADAQIPHRRLAAELFNDTWRLMMLPSRTHEQEAAMLASAHASLHHWSKVGGPKEAAIGHWQIARVSAMVGLFDGALWHARRCMHIADEHALGPFVHACAHEALARALALLGKTEAAEVEAARARALLPAITDAEDREVVESDLATIPLD